jgi:hypothetical protein
MQSNHNVRDKSVFKNGFGSLKYIKLVKTILLSGYFIYIFLLIGNVILAYFYGYNILTNFISDLGSAVVIPFPLLYDIISIFGGVITIFSNFYIIKKYSSNLSFISRFFLRIGFLSGIIGAIGYVFLGIFSLDRAGPGELYHSLAMGFSFAGYLTSIFFYSLHFFLTRDRVLKGVGIYGVTFPIIAVIVFGFIIIPLTEWILLFSILSFLFLFNYYIYK